MTEAGLWTVLDHRVEGDDVQRALIGALAVVHERWLPTFPGYHSTQFLASPNGRRVLSVVRWTSEADLANFEASGDHQAVMADVEAALAALPGPVDTDLSRFRLVRQVQAWRPKDFSSTSTSPGQSTPSTPTG
jgi:heme-degrading monooxygenase HmoA